MKEYWEICISEILSDHGIDLDEEKIKSIADDVTSCASVSYQYIPPVQGVDEKGELKKKIEKLEQRRPCPKCGGKGGQWEYCGPSHTSYSDCTTCNGTGWIN